MVFNVYLFLVPFVAFFSFCLLVLSYFNLVALVFIFLYYISLKICFFSNERQKGADPNGRAGRNKLEGVEGRKMAIMVYCMKIIYFQ